MVERLGYVEPPHLTAQKEKGTLVDKRAGVNKKSGVYRGFVRETNQGGMGFFFTTTGGEYLIITWNNETTNGTKYHPWLVCATGVLTQVTLLKYHDKPMRHP